MTSINLDLNPSPFRERLGEGLTKPLIYSVSITLQILLHIISGKPNFSPSPRLSRWERLVRGKYHNGNERKSRHEKCPDLVD
jgi:hypothetical protein